MPLRQSADAVDDLDAPRACSRDVLTMSQDPKARLDRRLGLAVERGGCFIEHQDQRVLRNHIGRDGLVGDQAPGDQSRRSHHDEHQRHGGLSNRPNISGLENVNADAPQDVHGRRVRRGTAAGRRRAGLAGACGDVRREKPRARPPFGPGSCYAAASASHRGRASEAPAKIRTMTQRLRLVLPVLLLLAVVGVAPARAHPHVWVTMHSELVYGTDGSVTGVRHAWTFDDMFSTFATQGIETKQKGVFTREDLAPLAEVNVTSLKEFDYFTHAKADGKKAVFTDPVDYWLEFKDGVLVLHFTLPLKTPVKAKTLALEMYDPTWFVDFTFADHDPVSLAGAPAACKLDVQRPATAAQPQQGQQLGEAFFNALTSASNYGAQFANRVLVMCP